MNVSSRFGGMVASVSLALAICSPSYGQSYITLGPPGQYSFQFSTNAQTKITSGPGWLKIEWAGDTAPAPPVVVPPPPDPGGVIPSNPSPPPATKPLVIPTTPLKGPIFLVAVYSGVASIKILPAAQQDLLADKSLGAALKPSQVYWRVYDLADPVLNGWRADAAGAGNPGLLVIGEGGHLVTSGSLPASKQAVLDLVKKLRGG